MDRLVLRPISDDTVRFAPLQSGDVDTWTTPYEWVSRLSTAVKGIGFVEARPRKSPRDFQRDGAAFQ